MVGEAHDAGDNAGVLMWESRLDEMLGCMEEADQLTMLQDFAQANFNTGNFAKAASLFQRCVPRLGKMERFRDQATTMSEVGESLIFLNESQPGAFEGAGVWYEKARKVGEQHGFYSAVSKP